MVSRVESMNGVTGRSQVTLRFRKKCPALFEAKNLDLQAMPCIYLCKNAEYVQYIYIYIIFIVYLLFIDIL